MMIMEESKIDANQLEILVMLKNVKNGYVSGETLSEKTGISRAAVWKHISDLRRMGYQIASIRGTGYALEKIADLLLPWEVCGNLETKFIGKEYHHFVSVDSTQDLANSMAEAGFPDGTVVVAERQKKGRGRIGRTWTAPYGGIWLSVILRPKIPPAESTIIPLSAALAVCNAIRKTCDVAATLKWPNDVIIDGRKVAGILLEMSSEADRIDYVVVGIGINANVDASKIESAIKDSAGYYGATSLIEELGIAVDRRKLLRQLLYELENAYSSILRGHSNMIIKKWKQLSHMLGKQVTVSQHDSEIKGVATDLDVDGALLIRERGGEIRRIVAGDVYVRIDKRHS